MYIPFRHVNDAGERAAEEAQHEGCCALAALAGVSLARRHGLL